MTISSVFTIALLTLLCASSLAQNPGTPPPPEGSQVASVAVSGQQYPRTFPDGRAVFYLYAPDATKVELALNQNRPMQNDGKGNWTITSEPIGPGFHPYEFIVDGARVTDPATQQFYDMGRNVSGIEISAPEQDFYTPKKVPHGSIQVSDYYSDITASWRRLFIYVPAGYDQNPNLRYPVLYLQHGAGQNESCWSNQGKAGVIMENMIADKACVPMIVVMPLGYATRPDEVAAQRPPNTPGARPDFSKMFSTVGEVLVKEVIPFVDSHLRTIADRDHRALAGLSMGGMQTFTYGLDNLDQFAYLGGFSGAAGAFGGPVDLKTFHNGVMADADKFNKRMRVVFLSNGTKEAEMMKGVLAFKETATKAGIDISYFESPGTAHEWQSWRRSLHHFAPMLFHVE